MNRVSDRKKFSWALFAVLIVSRGDITAQQQRMLSPTQSGLPVGVWEATQEDGSAVGLDVAAGVTARPADQERDKISQLQVGVFHRRHARVACGEENFFVIGLQAAGASSTVGSYLDHKLTIDYADQVNHAEIHVQLVLDEADDLWVGHFRRGEFDAQVKLHRTSRWPTPAQGGCLHW